MSTLLEQASLVLIPSGYKEDTVYSVIPSNGSGDMSFTRASDGTRINFDGLVEVCPWNLAQYSEQFNNAVYTTSNATITSNSITAPNDTLTADTITSTTIGSEARTRQTITQFGNSVYTLSCYAKKGNVDWFILRNLAVNAAGGSRAWFNLNTGAVGTTNSGVSATIQNVGNGWYRCTIYGTTDASPLSLVDIAPSSSDNVYLSNAIGEFVYIWGAQLNIGSTAKPYFPTTDRLNVPRLTYQNGGGGCPSLLLEPQRTNLVTYSEQFDNAYWVKNFVSVTANSATSPSGIVDADKIIPNILNVRHSILTPYNITVTSSAITASSYFKADGYNFTQLLITKDAVFSSYYSAIFDLSNGSVVSTAPFGGYVGTASIVSVGNNWYRCIITITNPTANSTHGVLIGSLSTGADVTFIGDGVKGTLCYGAQLEVGAYPSSYIPTVASSATRIADACSKTGIGSLIGQTEGVLFFDGIVNNIQNPSSNIINTNRTATTISTIALTKVKATNKIRFEQFLGNGTFVNIPLLSTNSFADGVRTKVAIRYKSGDFAMYINGNLEATNASTYTNIGVKTELYLNDVPTTFAYQESVSFNQVILFTALTNAQLALITSL